METLYNLDMKLPGQPIDDYWQESARRLSKVLAQIPDVKLTAAADDVQKVLRDYVAPSGAWDEETEMARSHFARIGRTEFESVWETYRENIRDAVLRLTRAWKCRIHCPLIYVAGARPSRQC